MIAKKNPTKVQQNLTGRPRKVNTASFRLSVLFISHTPIPFPSEDLPFS